MCKYSERTIYKKALNAGYKVEKGFQHYHYNNAIYTNWNGERFSGYNVWDLSKNCLEWESGCYDNNYDHLCTLEDVEIFVKAQYEKAGLEY